MRISELDDTQIIESGTEELFEPNKESLENILNSKKIMGISPIVHPVHPELYLQLLERGTEVSLILTRKVFDKLEKEYNDMLSRGLSFKNGSLYISDEDIKLVCVATDVFFSISLFFKNGVFDSKQDLISFNHLCSVKVRNFGKVAFFMPISNIQVRKSIHVVFKVVQQNR